MSNNLNKNISYNEAKLNFITNYGELAKNYKDLTPNGNYKKYWLHFIASFSFIIFMVLLLLFLRHKYYKTIVKLKNKKNKIFTEENLKKAMFIFLGIFIISLIFSGYIHFGVFKPQFKAWYNSLPLEGKKSFQIMKNA
jgi:hypothetical protein